MKRIVLVSALLFVVGCGPGTESATIKTRNVALPASFTTKQALAIAAGKEHTCAITNKSIVECWGTNRSGELGRSTTLSYSPNPLPVTGLPTDSKAVRIVSNSRAGHTCALFQNGDLYCWGFNSNWQVVEAVGDSTFSLPVRVATHIIDVAIAASATCSVNTNHQVQCWGSTSRGQLGDGGRFETTHQFVSRKMIENSYVATQGRVVQIVGGYSHFCVLYDDQTVDCWGENIATQAAGNVTYSGTAPVPIQVLGLPAIVAITASYGHSCAVDVGGVIWCWGAGWTTSSDNGPVMVPYASDSVGNSGPSRLARSIFSGEEETCIVNNGGDVNCFSASGGGLWHEFDGSSIRAATVVEDLRATAIGAIGVRHICIVSQFGVPKCRGLNNNGQSGLDRVQFPEVSQLSDVESYSESKSAIDFSRSPFLINSDFDLIGGGEAGSLPSTPPTVSDGSTSPGSTPATTKTYTMKVRRTASLRTLARWAGLKVSKGSKVSFAVKRGFARKCEKSAGKLRATRTGKCKVNVKVTKKGAKTRSKNVTITIVR